MNKIGFVIDPINKFNTKKDTTFAMMLEAQRRDCEIYIMQQNDLALQHNEVFAHMKKITVTDRQHDFYQVIGESKQPLNTLDFVIMRKDPPFNMNYIYTTYLLELAEQQGLRVINKPQSLRDANEKLFIAQFPQCCPKTLVTAKQADILHFLDIEKNIILKPLDSMGGQSIFHITDNNKATLDIINTMTIGETTPIMAQRFIPDIKAGDKRVLVIHGKPVPYALARIPKQGDFRGNLAQGASAKGQELSERDRFIANEVGPTLKAKGLLFVGLDIIGDYLTEINVTSPTCVRELDAAFDLNICADFFDELLS